MVKKFKKIIICDDNGTFNENDIIIAYKKCKEEAKDFFDDELNIFLFACNRGENRMQLYKLQVEGDDCGKWVNVTNNWVGIDSVNGNIDAFNEFIKNGGEKHTLILLDYMWDHSIYNHAFRDMIIEKMKNNSRVKMLIYTSSSMADANLFLIEKTRDERIKALMISDYAFDIYTKGTYRYGYWQTMFEEAVKALK